MTKDEMIKVMSSSGPWQHRRWVTPSGDASNGWEDDPDPSWNWLTYEYRAKPRGKVVPLGPTDFPPFCIVRHSAWPDWSWAYATPSHAGVTAIVQPSDPDKELMFLSWDDLLRCWSRSFDGGKTWLPCYKIE